MSRGNTRLVPVDIGNGLYARMRRPAWMEYAWRFVALFCGIVWRRWDEECTPIDVRTAPSIANGINGVSAYRHAMMSWRDGR